MKTYKQVARKEVDEIFCDCCGKSCTITEPVIEHEYATLEATWGYFSGQDGTQYAIEICETCFDQILGLLKDKRRKILGPFKYPHDNDPLQGKSYL